MNKKGLIMYGLGMAYSGLFIVLRHSLYFINANVCSFHAFYLSMFLSTYLQMHPLCKLYIYKEFFCSRGSL
jgi:hypothetical protein